MRRRAWAWFRVGFDAICTTAGFEAPSALGPETLPRSVPAVPRPAPSARCSRLAHAGRGRGRPTLLAAICLVLVSLAACQGSSAPPDGFTGYYGTVDYHWLTPVSNFVAARQQSDDRRVPPLLQQGCQLSPADRSEQGENYTTHIVAEAALLRLEETDPSAVAAAVPGSFLPVGWPFPQMLDSDDNVKGTYATCLDNWAPGWRRAVSGRGAPADTRPGWADVINEVEAIPPFHGTPGTDGVPGCRGSDPEDGNWDIQMAYLIRAWAMLKAEPSSRLPRPIDQLAHDFATRVWLQGGVADEDHVICTGPLGVPLPGESPPSPETENHEFLIRTDKFLHNELLPIVDTGGADNGSVGKYDVDSNANNATNGLDAYVYGQMRDWVDLDFIEYNARPYGRYQMLGLLNLYDFAGAQRTRGAAEAPLDFLSAKHAAESMDRLRIAPFRRRIEYSSEDLVIGDTIAPMYAVWVGGLSLPGYVVPGPHGGAGGEMSLAASSDYRPPDLLVDRMLNRSHRDFFEQFNGQGQEEAGYAGPDFTITGGGRATDCPYDACFGSGNDHGTSVPITLIPHRSRLPANKPTEDPTASSVLSVQHGVTDSCIYRNFACGASVTVDAATARGNPSCALTTPDRLGNAALALRFDQAWQGPAYAGDCFFVYTAQLRDTSITPFAFFVTHSCDPSWSAATVVKAFNAFDQYMRTTGAPDQHDSGVNGVRIRLPTETSLEPGEVVDAGFNQEACDGCGPYEVQSYWIISPAPAPSASLAGDLVSFVQRGSDRSRLVYRDPGAEETMYSTDDGANPIQVGGPFSFSWKASLSRSGHAHVEVTAAGHPEELRRVTLDVVDAAPEPGCTLGNGLQGCPTGPCYGGYCSSPPPRQQSARVYDQVYGYGSVPLTHGQPLTIDGTPTPIKLGDPYVIYACVTWWAYLTPEGDRPLGADPDSPEQCDTIRIEASDIRGGNLGRFSPTHLSPVHVPIPTP